MKLKNLGTALIVSGLLLTGCSSNDEQKTTVCKGSADLDKVEFVSEGDKVITQTEYYEYTYEEMQITEEDAADKEYWDSVAKEYETEAGLSKGLEVKIENNAEAKTLTLIFVLNYTEADMTELENMGLVDKDGANYISLEKTVANFEATEGVTCE